MPNSTWHKSVKARNRLYADEEWLSTVMSIFFYPKYIAKMCGVSQRTISKYVKKYKIARGDMSFLRPLEMNDLDPDPIEVDI